MKGYEMSFLDAFTTEESETFQTTNLEPYREVLDRLREGFTGTLTVPTGVLIDKGTNKGKGKDAMVHHRALRDVAKERGIGLRIKHINMPGNKTQLRMRIGPLREMNPKAEAALAAYREEQKKGKEAAAKAEKAAAAKKAAANDQKAAQVRQNVAKAG